MKENLGFGSLGNGISVWDRTREKNNDYLMVAHITVDRTITWRAEVSKEQKAEIERFAREADPTVSISQEAKVFSARPNQ